MAIILKNVNSKRLFPRTSDAEQNKQKSEFSYNIIAHNYGVISNYQIELQVSW